MSSAEEQEARLYQIAEGVHGKGTAISYDPIPPDHGNTWRGIVWDARGEAISSHYGKSKEAVRARIVRALQAFVVGRDKARKAERDAAQAVEDEWSESESRADEGAR